MHPPSQSLPRHILFLLAGIIALAPLAIDAYIPAFPNIAKEFGVDPLHVSATMSAYLVGFSFGQIFGGPLSDQVGRKLIGCIGLSAFIVITILIMNVNSLDQMIGLRFLQALGGGLGSSIAIPTLRDMSSPDKSASRVAFIFLFMLLAPLVAPMIGFSLLPLGWRWIFLFLAAYALVTLVIYFFAIQETRVVEKRKIKFGAIIGQFKQVVRHSPDGHHLPVKYGVACAFSSGMMLIYLTNASYIFQTHYQLDARGFMLFFGANVVSLASVQFISARYLKGLKLPEIANYFRFGMRLQLAIFITLAVVTLFIDPPIALFMTLLVSGIACGGIINPSGTGLYMSSYKKLSGSASALLTTFTVLTGAALGYLSGLVNTGTLLPAALALMASTLIANIMISMISKQHEQQLLAKISSGEIEPL